MSNQNQAVKKQVKISQFITLPQRKRRPNLTQFLSKTISFSPKSIHNKSNTNFYSAKRESNTEPKIINSNLFLTERFSKTESKISNKKFLNISNFTPNSYTNASLFNNENIIHELKQIIKQKDSTIFELQKRINSLQKECISLRATVRNFHMKSPIRLKSLNSTTTIASSIEMKSFYETDINKKVKLSRITCMSPIVKKTINEIKPKNLHRKINSECELLKNLKIMTINSPTKIIKEIKENNNNIGLKLMKKKIIHTMRAMKNKIEELEARNKFLEGISTRTLGTM